MTGIAGYRPIIGLTTYLEQARTGVWDVPASFLPAVYFDAVVRAGAIAVLLPPQAIDSAIAQRVIDGIDGLIITGGKDVDPARYGQVAHPQTDAPRLDRDAWEDSLLKAAISRGLPFLGICRGLQVLNVSLGGSLHQHLPDVIGSARYNRGAGDFSTNQVTFGMTGVVPALLADTPSLAVQSYHHQAVDRVGNGLLATAHSDDGTVQAIELTSQPFGIAVQWHPEQDQHDLRLFSGLTIAASAYRSRVSSDLDQARNAKG